MADEEEHESGGEEEEPEEFPPYLAISDEPTLQKVLSSASKVVAVAFLIDGYSHCESAKEWLEGMAEEGTYTGNVQFVVINPDVMPTLARQCNIDSLPAFAYFWRRGVYRVFSGTNQEKFTYALTKMVELRTKEIEDAKAKSLPQPSVYAGLGDSVQLCRGSRKISSTSLVVTWGHVPTDEPWPISIAAACLGSDNTLLSTEDFVYSGNQQNSTESIIFKGVADTKVDPKDKSNLHSNIAATLDINFSKLDQSTQSIPIIVYMDKCKDEKVQYLSQVFHMYVQLHNRDNDKVPFKLYIDMLKYGVPVTANGVRIGAFTKDNTGKWTFECVTQGMNISDINTILNQFKQGQQPFRGHVGTLAPTLLTPSKVFLQRLRPTLVTPSLEFGWDCEGNPVANGYIGAILCNDADGRSFPKNKQHVMFNNGDKVNNCNAVTLTVNNNSQTFSAEVKLAALAQDIWQVIFIGIAKNDANLSNGFTIIRDKDNSPLAKVCRDCNTKAQKEWLAAQYDIVTKWRSSVVSLQNQSLKTKDKEKEASIMSQLAVLPQFLDIPQFGQPKVLPLGSLVKRKLSNDAGNVWEYWSDPTVDHNALMGIVQGLAS